MKCTNAGHNAVCFAKKDGSFEFLRQFLAPHLEKIKSLVFDFKECDFVSSAGIRVLLSSFKTLKKNQGDMRLENVGPNFKEVLEATGLDVAFGIL